MLRLVDDESAPPMLYTYYALANWFHSRFYGGPPDVNIIRHGKTQIADFIRMLEGL